MSPKFPGNTLRPIRGVLHAGRGNPGRRGRKGIFHIAEIVIIFLVMFVMIIQISYMPVVESGWEKTKLISQARDMLFSLNAAGIDWSDEAVVSDYIGYAFNSSRIMARVEYVGAPQDDIFVGCLCDGSASCNTFCSWLKGTLEGYNPLTFNKLGVELRVTNTGDINNLMDVIVTNMELNGYEDSLRRYLSSSKGFVLVKDLGPGDFTDYGDALRDYSVTFNMEDMAYSPDYYRIPGYFSDIPNGTGYRYNDSHVFGAFSTDPVRKVLGPGGFEVLRTSTGPPACIAKLSAANNKGRSAWLSDSASRGDDWSALLASLVIWSSEQRRVITDAEIGKEEATVSIYRIPLDTSRPDYMFQPTEVVLTLGYLYS
jgi:hypothetical protein